MKTRYPLARWAVILFAILCPLMAARGAESPSSRDQVFTRALEGLTNAGRRADSERTLLRLAEDKDETVRAQARAALSAFRRQALHAKDALALVNPYADMRPENLTLPQLNCYLEAALCQVALNQSLSAFKLLDYARERTESLPAVLTRVALADAVEPVPDLDKALAYVKEALAYGDRWFQRARISEAGNEVEPAKPGDAEWRKLRPELLARIRRLERQQRIAKWGLDYVLYLEAQEARKADDPFALDFTNVGRIYPRAGLGNPPSPGADYKKALETYDLIIQSYPESVFGEAARLYRWVCLAKLGQTDAALKGLETFYRQNPNGLYQGEALKLLGDLWLEDRWDANKAAKYYQQAVDWCHNARSLKEAARLFAVPAKCMEPATPPPDWQNMDNFGVIAYAAVPPGAVVNRLTAAWYLNRLDEEAEFALGFLRSVANDWEGALAHFQRALELDPLLQKAEANKYYNTFLRLKGSCAKRAYVGEKEENSGVQGQSRLAMMRADFIYMLMYFQQAESLYTRLYRAAGEQRDGNIAARAGLGLILAAMQQEHMDTARLISEEVVKRWPKAPSAPYCCFLCGHTYGPGPSNDYSEAVACYRKVSTLFPKSRLAETARYYEIFKGINPINLEERRGWIARFKRDYPKSQHITAIDEQVAFMQSFAAKYGLGRPTSQTNGVESAL